MSNHLAIATTTATLAQILEPAASSVPNAEVKLERPDAPPAGTPAPRINLFLYQITPNSALRNADLPTRSPSGSAVQRSMSAWDLSYLITFYGNEGSLEPQRLAGAALRQLHARPMLTRDDIVKVKQAAAPTNGSDPVHEYLKDTDLHEQIEMIRFSPLPTNLEEMSKLWSVFFQTPYALSVAWRGTVVLIDGQETPQPALPVRERRVHGMLLKSPRIEDIGGERGVDQPLVVGDTLIMRGRDLRGETTRVLIGGIELTPNDVFAGEIRLKLEAATFPPGSLRAGVLGAQVVHKLALGQPATSHRGFESNVAPFVLRPTITAVVVRNAVGAGNAVRSADVDVTVTPPVRKGQRVALLLVEDADETPSAYTFFAEPPNADQSVTTVAVKGVKAANYLVRLQVDGAESPLQVSPDPLNPRYIGPKLTIP